MRSRDFVYWLQGYFEIARSGTTEGNLHLDPKQIKIIENHLALVFKHEIDAPDPTGELQAIHDGGYKNIEGSYPFLPLDQDTKYRC